MLVIPDYPNFAVGGHLIILIIAELWDSLTFPLGSLRFLAYVIRFVVQIFQIGGLLDRDIALTLHVLKSPRLVRFRSVLVFANRS